MHTNVYSYLLHIGVVLSQDDAAWGGNYFSVAEGDSYIINGDDAEKGRWPWLLSLEVYDPEFRHTCGATLLGNTCCVYVCVI